MNPELSKLVQLQHMDREMTALAERIAGYPRTVAACNAELAKTAEELERNARDQAAETAARRRMESDIEDFRQKGARYRAQLDDVQSDSQMKALEHQIAFCLQEIGRMEDVELASLMRTEELETRRRTLHETAANQQLAFEKEKAAIEEERQRTDAERESLAKERNALRGGLDAALLAKYDRIAATGKAPVAEVAEPRCSACQMSVRPQRWNEVREGAVCFCESCGRFLSYNPPVDLSDAIALPSA